MKRLLKVLIVSLIFLTSCGGSNDKGDTPSSNVKPSVSVPTPSVSSSSPKIEKKYFEGITLNGKTVTYDGNEHKLEAQGVPEFAKITYSNNGPFINAGEYEVSILVTAEGYHDFTQTAKLKIVNADLQNISFSDAIFEYDGLEKRIDITGNIPNNAIVTYTSDVPGIQNIATEIGEYNITALIQVPNFNDLTLNAKLTIKAVDDERYIKASGDTLFFQNALDENKLYAYNFNESNLAKVSNDNAVAMEVYDDNSIIYVSKSILTSSIKMADYDDVTNKTSKASLLNKNARYIQVGNSTTIYYVINGLLNSNSGIYKADLSGEEPTITLLSEGKAKYLQLVGDKLYFADGTNGYKLSSISVNGENQSRSLLLDEKINNLYINEGDLYFTVNNLLGDYIAKYNIESSTLRKLTIDAGIDFVFIGNYLYYINLDFFTSSIIGNGIYRVSKDSLTDNLLPGEKVIEGGEMGLCSLTSYGESLIYYDVNGYKLMNYSVKDKTYSNILEGFVKPVDPAPTSFGSDVEAANGLIYYLDIFDEKTLHSYNPITKANYRLTSEKVDNFSIIGDYIYYNMVSYGVNNDTYRMNYKTGDVPQLVNTFDSKEVVSDGKYIYYVERNAAGVSTSIHKANMDGSNDFIIFNYGADNLVLDNGTLYFCAKPNLVQTIMKIENVANVTTQQEKICVNDDYACDVFTIHNGIIYFRQNYGVGYFKHRLAKMNIDGTGYAEMVTSSTDPTEIIVYEGYVYYANGADTANDFELYRISLNGKDGQQEKLTTNKFVSSICAYDGKIYFVNYHLVGLEGDSNLYSISTSTKDIEQLTHN